MGGTLLLVARFLVPTFFSRWGHDNERYPVNRALTDRWHDNDTVWRTSTRKHAIGMICEFPSVENSVSARLNIPILPDIMYSNASNPVTSTFPAVLIPDAGTNDDLRSRLRKFTVQVWHVGTRIHGSLERRTGVGEGF